MTIHAVTRRKAGLSIGCLTNILAAAGNQRWNIPGCQVAARALSLDLPICLLQRQQQAHINLKKVLHCNGGYGYDYLPVTASQGASCKQRIVLSKGFLDDGAGKPAILTPMFIRSRLQVEAVPAGPGRGTVYVNLNDGHRLALLDGKRVPLQRVAAAHFSQVRIWVHGVRESEMRQTRGTIPVLVPKSRSFAMLLSPNRLSNPYPTTSHGFMLSVAVCHPVGVHGSW